MNLQVLPCVIRVCRSSQLAYGSITVEIQMKKVVLHTREQADSKVSVSNFTDKPRTPGVSHPLPLYLDMYRCARPKAKATEEIAGSSPNSGREGQYDLTNCLLLALHSDLNDELWLKAGDGHEIDYSRSYMPRNLGLGRSLYASRKSDPWCNQ